MFFRDRKAPPPSPCVMGFMLQDRQRLLKASHLEPTHEPYRQAWLLCSELARYLGMPAGVVCREHIKILCARIWQQVLSELLHRHGLATAQQQLAAFCQLSIAPHTADLAEACEYMTEYSISRQSASVAPFVELMHHSGLTWQSLPLWYVAERAYTDVTRQAVSAGNRVDRKLLYAALANALTPNVAISNQSLAALMVDLPLHLTAALRSAA